MDMPMDYRVGCYAVTLSNTHAKADQHYAELNDRFVDHRNDLLHEFINKAIVSFFAIDFDHGCCNWWAMILWTLCLNTEWAIGIWYSSLIHLSCWWKAVQNLIHYLLIFNVQLYVHLKKWTLKFKLLYLLNHISHFNKICRIYCTYKLWKFGSNQYSYGWNTEFFSRGLFFIVFYISFEILLESKHIHIGNKLSKAICKLHNRRFIWCLYL